MSSVQLEVGEDEELNTESSLCSVDRQNIYPHYLYMDLITHAHTHVRTFLSTPLFFPAIGI